MEMTVDTLSRATSWAGVDIPTYRAYCRACNMDMMNAVQIRRNEIYLNGRMSNGTRQRPLFLHLKKDPAWTTYYRPLMEVYIQSLRAAIQPTTQPTNL
jgi:hypothetical protein